MPHALLRDTIAVEDYGGSGAMGPTFSASRNIRASVQGTGRLLTDGQGRVVSGVSRVVIRPESGPVPIESRVTFASVKYRVVEAYPVPDARRPTQWELMLALWAST